jgi:hypothetical protein
MMFVVFTSTTTGLTYVAGTVRHYKAFDFTLVVRGVRVTRSLFFYVMFCRSLFVLFRLAIMLSVLFPLAIVLSVLFLLTIVLSVLLRVTDSDYLFGVCKLFLFMTIFYYNPATPSTKRAPTIHKLGTS